MTSDISFNNFQIVTIFPQMIKKRPKQTWRIKEKWCVECKKLEEFHRREAPKMLGSTIGREIAK